MSHEELMADVADYAERRFPVGAPTDNRLCATGEPVLTLTSGGVKEEGACHAAYCSTPEKAAELFKAEFDKYAAGKDGVLYWRCKPLVHKAEFLDPYYPDFAQNKGFTLYCIAARLIITNKRVTQ